MHDIDEMIYADPIDCKEHSTKWVKIIHKISSYAGIVKMQQIDLHVHGLMAGRLRNQKEDTT